MIKLIINKPNCKICNITFKTIYGYKQHISKHIFIPKLYHCPYKVNKIICLKKYSNKKILLFHIENYHLIKKEKSINLIEIKKYKDEIRLKVFISFIDYYKYFGGINYLLNGGMCLKCLKFSIKINHRYKQHSVNLTICLFCNKCIKGINFFKHSISINCKRPKIEFFRGFILKSLNNELIIKK